MRATDFFNEDLFGTEPKRPARSGSRPNRGHNSEPRYKATPVVQGGDNPDAVHVPNKGDEPVQRGDHVMVQDPDNIATVHSGVVKRIGREHVYVILKSGETIAAPHDEVSKSYDVLSKRAHRILDKKGKWVGNYKVSETVLNPKDPKGDLAAKRKALHDLSMTKGVDQEAVRQRKLDLEREAERKGVKEECAGVGIVTKQNSTADVGPGTINKNLKAFNLESHDDDDYVQQLTSEFIRRAKLGRNYASPEAILGLLDRFFKKFSISDRYFDDVYHRAVRTTDHEAGILEMEAELDEWKASRQLCRSSTPDADLGASALSSCKSQGLRARDGNKSHKLGKSPKSRTKMGGHRIKGKKYGGPLPDWS